MNNQTIAIKKLLLDARVNQGDLSRMLGVSIQRISHAITFERTSGPGIQYVRTGIYNILRARLGAARVPEYDELWSCPEEVTTERCHAAEGTQS